MRGLTRFATLRLAALLIATLLLVWAAALVPALADKRVALIIGNSAYEHADKLSNPVSDARNLRDVLRTMGFADENIIFGQDLTKRDMERAIGRFAILARDADVALAYYAGHGATFGDIPYIVPVDARFETVDQMPYELEPLEAMVGELRKARGVRIAIVDACRDNAAERSLKRTDTRGGAITRGLARLPDVDGLIVAYATQYLATAEDGPNGTNSPFTAALLKHLPTPGLDVKDLFFEVGRDVLASTKGRQRPEVKISFYEKYALVAPPAGEAGAGALSAAPVLSAVVVPPPVRPDQAAFDAAMQADTPAALDAYLARFPVGLLTDIARRERERLAKLAALPPPVPAAPPPPVPPFVISPPPVPSAGQQAFDAAMQADTPGALDAYLARFPAGTLSDIARRERERLLKLAALPAPPQPNAAAVLPPAPAVPTTGTPGSAVIPPAPMPPPKTAGWVHALKKSGSAEVSPPATGVPADSTPARQYVLPEGAKLVALPDEFAINALAYAPDGRSLAAGKSDGTLQLWDAASGKMLLSWEGRAKGGNVLAFSPDGSLIASASNDPGLKLWDARSGKLVRSIGASTGIRAVSFAPDGKSVVTGSDDAGLKQWDAETGSLLRAFIGHNRPIAAIAVSPDGKTLLSGGGDRKLKLWDMATGRLLLNLPTSGGDISALGFFPDGRSFFSCARGETVSLWEAGSGRLLRGLVSPGGHMISAAISPDGKMVLAGGDDGALRLWDVESGKLLRTLEGPGGEVQTVAFAPNGKTMLSGGDDSTMRLWSAASGKLLATYFALDKQGVAFTPTGNFVTDANPREAFAIKRGDERLPLDDFIAANQRQVLSKAANAQ